MPRFEPDFTQVQASTPVYEKGPYELSTERISGSAWNKTDSGGDSYQVRRVRIGCKVQGFIDSKGKVKKDHPEHGDIEGKDVKPIDLYIHSPGAMKMAKRQMMAILGYNADEPKDEEAFNEWLKGGVDLGFDAEPSEDGDGFDVTLGDGWETFVGKRVIAYLDKEMYQRDESAEPEEQQVIGRLSPVGS